LKRRQSPSRKNPTRCLGARMPGRCRIRHHSSLQPRVPRGPAPHPCDGRDAGAASRRPSIDPGQSRMEGASGPGRCRSWRHSTRRSARPTCLSPPRTAGRAKHKADPGRPSPSCRRRATTPASCSPVPRLAASPDPAGRKLHAVLPRCGKPSGATAWPAASRSCASWKNKLPPAPAAACHNSGRGRASFANSHEATLC
jgi:hypothetical protein